MFNVNSWITLGPFTLAFSFWQGKEISSPSSFGRQKQSTNSRGLALNKAAGQATKLTPQTCKCARNKKTYFARKNLFQLPPCIKMSVLQRPRNSPGPEQVEVKLLLLFSVRLFFTCHFPGSPGPGHLFGELCVLTRKAPPRVHFSLAFVIVNSLSALMPYYP